MGEKKTSWIYSGRDKLFEIELKRLKEWKISNRNKELITKFQNYLFSIGCKEERVTKLSSQLRRICLLLKNDMDKVTKEDIQNLVIYYNKEDKYRESTKSNYKKTIKQFYKWFKDEDNRLYSKDEKTQQQVMKLYKYIEKDIKVTYKEPKIDPKTIITDEEIDSIIEKGCKTIRDKALIKFLHETGVRVGELLNIKIGDLEIKEDYATVIVDGKTGKRTIPIVNSLPYIVQYLSVHPYKDNMNSHLWIGESLRYLNKPIMYRGCQKIIYRAFKRVGLEHKRQNLHWFRHSRASLLAPHLTEVMLCSYMGWVVGSKQVRTYLHLTEKQLQDAFLEMKGLKKEERKEVRKPQKCVCGCINDTNAKYCYKCGKPLSVKVIMEDKKS